MKTAAAAVLLAIGCSKQDPAPTTPPTDATAAPTDAAPAGEEAPAAEVVKNVDAQPGDTTTCPFSGKTFVVKAEHPKVEYEGQSYWICSDKAAESVRADPAKYLADFEG